MNTLKKNNFFRAVWKNDTKHFLKIGVIALFLVAVFGISENANSVFAHTDSRINMSAAVAYAAQCQNNADVTIGFGGLGTGIVPQLSNGVYYPTKATPGGKYYGCMVVGCRGLATQACNYVKQQANAAGRRITVDALGHSAGADATAAFARCLAGTPNVYLRRIVAADATAFAGAIPAGVGHVVNLNSTWNGKSPLRGSSPIQYVNRADRDHFSIDDLIPENMPCLGGENACPGGSEEACKNRCSTTYVEVNGSTPKVTDCYGKGEDRAKKAVEKLVQCVAKNSEGVTGPDDIQRKYELLLPEFESGMCIAQWGSGASRTRPAEEQAQESLEKDGEYFAIISTLPLVVFPIKTPPVPRACASEYNTILGITGAHNGDQAAAQFGTSATTEDVSKCAWKGAVICFPDTQKPGKFTCKKKIDTHQPGTTTPGNSVTQCVLNSRGNQAAVTQCLNSQPTAPLPPGTTGLGGSPFGGDKGSQQSPFQQPEQTCPTGYTKGVKDGKTGCIKDSEKDAAKPQCLFITNKETVSEGGSAVLQWRTVGAEKVVITNITSNVEKSGKLTVRPTKTTTYKLTATGKGKDNAKTCEITVKVEGSEELTGENQPLLGCSPDTIAKGGTGKILWSCAAGADAIEGTGFNPQGRLKGEAIVRPVHNTQYGVTCSKNGEVMGENACSVRVGEPQLSVLVQPEQVAVGERVRVSWASLFMKSCRVQGPRGFDYTRDQGVVITEPFTSQHTQINVQATKYTVVCESEFGGTFSKDVAVRLQN